MTPTEASLRLGISYDFVLRLLRTKKLRGRRNQKGWHVDQGSVDQYLLGMAARRARRNGGKR